MFCLSENEKTSSTSAFSGTTSKYSAEKRKERAYTSGIRIHWSCDYCLKFAQSRKDLIKRLTDQAKDQDQDGFSSSWFARLSRKTIEWFFLTRGGKSFGYLFVRITDRLCFEFGLIQVWPSTDLVSSFISFWQKKYFSWSFRYALAKIHPWTRLLRQITCASRDRFGSVVLTPISFFDHWNGQNFAGFTVDFQMRFDFGKSLSEGNFVVEAEKGGGPGKRWAMSTNQPATMEINTNPLESTLDGDSAIHFLASMDGKCHVQLMISELRCWLQQSSRPFVILRENGKCRV